jgi:DNA-binding response OmpR family regulator
MSDTSTDTSISTPRIPTVYFIDDSATMREVIKIAFRKENIHVVACHDAASALAQFPLHRPDVVITDVIMPDKDGYEVCRHVKEQPELAGVPVILMSGVVNRQVAERAMAASADELMRKPFQPQELVTRVKAFLQPKPSVENSAARTMLDSTSAAGRALNDLFAPRSIAPPPSHNPAATPNSSGGSIGIRAQHAANQAAHASFADTNTNAAAPNSAAASAANAEALKLRAEIRLLQMLVKKLQSELEAERQYTAELETQLRVNQETN